MIDKITSFLFSFFLYFEKFLRKKKEKRKKNYKNRKKTKNKYEVNKVFLYIASIILYLSFM